jgi:hypothetical protein
MNFKLKALVAAVALAAVAGQASAALTLPTDTQTSDALFFALDIKAGTSYVYDLGSVSSLTSTLSTGVNVTTSSAWTSFAASAASTSDITWGIVYATGDANNYSWGTTLTSGKTAAKVLSGKVNSGVATAFDSYAKTTSLTQAGDSQFSNATDASNFVVSNKNTWGGNATAWTDNNAIGTKANLYTFVGGAAGTLSISGINFDGSTVSIAAVPEPETYSMLAAGLLMLGAVARRRKA